MATSHSDLIVRVSSAIGTARTLCDIYDAVLDELREAFGVDRASILLFDPDGVMRFKAWRGLSDAYRAAVEGHTPWTAGQPAPDPIVVRDVRHEPSLAAFGDLFDHEGIRSLAFVPLVAGGCVIGKFMLYRDTAGPFDPDALASGRAVGFLLGFAVERTRMLNQEATLRDRLTVLTDGSQRLLTSVAADSVVSEVLALASQVIAADGYAVWRRTGAHWGIVGSHGLSDAFITTTLTADGSTYTFDRPIVAPDLGSVSTLAQRTQAYAAEGIVSLVSVPLPVRGVAAGSIVFYYRSRHEPSEPELRVAIALGHLAAAAISNVELYAEQRDVHALAEAARQRAAFLAEASARLSTLDYEENLRTIAQLIVPRFAEWCVVDLGGEDGTVKRLTVAHTDPGKVALAEDVHRRYPPDLNQPSGVGQVLRTGEPELYEEIDDALLVRSATDPEHLRLLREVGIRSAILVPLAAGSRVFGTISFVRGDGAPRYAAADVEFACELGRRAGFAIENARLYDEAQRANRLKDEFLATLSHELRTPLNVMLGRAQMISGAGDVDAARQLAAVIERNGQTLASLVDDLLDVSRMTLGQVKLDRESVLLPAVIDAAVQAVQPAADAKRLDLSVSIAPGIPAMVGDPTRLQQVAWNLLLNAVKFTPPGGRVHVALTSDGQTITFAVADSGEGLAADALPRVFEMFWQAEPTRSRRYGGLGLGLSIVRRLVELHGGQVQAESAGPGQGTTFTVTLPCAGGAPAHVAGDAAAPAG